jgi:endonuclease YncB( thermonuclease family)
MTGIFLCAIAWVIDGDTFICSDGRHVRIAGIDAPEIHACPPRRSCTPGNARASLWHLVRLAKGKTASCQAVGTSYDRTLAFCSIPAAVGGAGPGIKAPIDLACAQLTGGYAIRRYSFGPQVCRRYAAATGVRD